MILSDAFSLGFSIKQRLEDAEVRVHDSWCKGDESTFVQTLNNFEDLVGVQQ